MDKSRKKMYDDNYTSGQKFPEHVSAYKRLLIKVAVVPLMFIGFLSSPLFGFSEAFGQNFTVTPIRMVTFDADGENLAWPYFLFYDPLYDETYLTANGGSQVIVYSSDFFPLISFSSGRDLYVPQGGFVDQNGLIYVCQGISDNKPSRISVYNGAFLLTREIFLDQIPGAPDFAAKRLVVSREGLIYVAGNRNRGVVVLDYDGNFQRWLQPQDELPLSSKEIAAMRKKEEESRKKKTEIDQSSEDQSAEKAPLVDIPEQFRPKSKEEKMLSGSFVGPAMINSINIDREGRLYLLSAETGKIYVYNAEEEFLFSFGTKGGTPRTLSQPYGLGIDEDKRLIYVIDYMRHTVLVYDQDNGTYLFEFGGRGWGPGWFNFPTDIMVNKHGQVIVSDLFNQRLQVLEVNYQRNIPALPELSKKSP